ncbi:MAG: hypothetical protein ABSH52_17125 [Terriglobia bacterium]|jgi:hypothetical protein
MEDAEAEALIDRGQAAVADEGITGSGHGFRQKGNCDQCPNVTACPAMRGESCRNPVRTWVGLPGEAA